MAWIIFTSAVLLNCLCIGYPMPTSSEAPDENIRKFLVKPDVHNQETNRPINPIFMRRWDSDATFERKNPVSHKDLDYPQIFFTRINMHRVPFDSTYNHGAWTYPVYGGPKHDTFMTSDETKDIGHEIRADRKPIHHGAVSDPAYGGPKHDTFMTSDNTKDIGHEIRADRKPIHHGDVTDPVYGGPKHDTFMTSDKTKDIDPDTRTDIKQMHIAVKENEEALVKETSNKDTSKVKDLKNEVNTNSNFDRTKDTFSIESSKTSPHSRVKRFMGMGWPYMPYGYGMGGMGYGMGGMGYGMGGYASQSMGYGGGGYGYNMMG